MRCLADHPDDDPTIPAVARYAISVEQPDGTFTTVDQGRTDFIAGPDLSALGGQASCAAALYRAEEGVAGRVRVRLETVGGSAATGEAGPPTPEHQVGWRDLSPAEQDVLAAAYADGAVVTRDGHGPAEALVAAGLLARGPQVHPGRRRYYPDGPVEAAVVVQADLDGRWVQVGDSVRRLPDADPDTLHALAQVVARAQRGPETVRVSVAAGSEVAWVEQAPPLTGRLRRGVA